MKGVSCIRIAMSKVCGSCIQRLRISKHGVESVPRTHSGALYGGAARWAKGWLPMLLIPLLLLLLLLLHLLMLLSLLLFLKLLLLNLPPSIFPGLDSYSFSHSLSLWASCSEKTNESNYYQFEHWNDDGIWHELSMYIWRSEIDFKLFLGSIPCLTTRWWRRWTYATPWAMERRQPRQQALDMLPIHPPTITQVNLLKCKYIHKTTTAGEILKSQLQKQ